MDTSFNNERKAYAIDATPYVANMDELFAQTGITNPFAEVDPANYRMNRRGKLSYQQDLAEAQHLAQMQLMMYQNEYNSPSAQRDRMVEAGMNPALHGLSGEPSAGMAGVASPDTSSIPTNGELVQRGLGMVSTVVSMTNALSSGFLGLSKAVTDISGGKIANTGRLAELANTFAPAMLMGVDGISNLENADDWNDVDGRIKHFVDNSGLGRKDRKRLSEFMHRFSMTPDAYNRAYSAYTASGESRAGYAKSLVSPTGVGAEFADLLHALQPLARAEFEIAKHQISGQLYGAQNTEDYNRTFDAVGAAQADNSENKARKGEADIQEIVRKGALSTLDNLKKAMENDKWWAAPALTAIYATLSGVSGPSGSFQSNTTQDTDRYGNPQESRKTQFSLGW